MFADLAAALRLAAALQMVVVRDEQLAVPDDDVRDLPSVGACGAGRPFSSADSSANSHGRPRQPRPMTTPSQPVRSIIATASMGSKMSPLPEHGDVGDVLLSRVISSQSAVPDIAATRSGMQRNGFGAFGGGDAAGVEMGAVLVVDADAELDRHRDVGALGGADRGGDDALNSLRL